MRTKYTNLGSFRGAIEVTEMTRRPLWATGVLVIAVACAIFIYSRYLGAEMDGCANYHEKTIVSPGGKSKAIVFDRDCGAVGGYTRNVSILPVSGDLPNAPANALSMSLRNTSADDLAVKWRGDYLLTIRSVTYSGACSASDIVNSVRVSYKLGALGSFKCGQMRI